MGEAHVERVVVVDWYRPGVVARLIEKFSSSRHLRLPRVNWLMFGRITSLPRTKTKSLTTGVAIER
jgi:hypothetical protein